MNAITLILLAAGNSSRFGNGVKKQWIRVGETPLWEFVTKRFIHSGHFADVIVVAHADEQAYMASHGDYTIVVGGETRQHSLRNALEHVNTEFVMVTDVARACIAPELIKRLIKTSHRADCIVPTLGVHDTVVYQGNTIDRNALQRVQTPQLSRAEVLQKALQTETEYTDESSAILAAGGTRHFIPGDARAHKLTTPEDLAALKCLSSPTRLSLIGNGLDVHAFDDEGTMVLGGVTLDHPHGFKAHSDGDVAIHALIDALLGAAGMEDIGTLFPDSDDAYRGIASTELLESVVTRLHRFGFEMVNADLTIAAQTPRLAPYKTAMRRTLASLLHLPPVRVNVKATTTESLGFVGRKEGVAVFATATLRYIDWTEL